MWSCLANGWKLSWKNPFLLLLLSLYHTVWAMLIYQLVKSVVVPLLYRFPGAELTALSRQVFLAESEFQLTKTDISLPYVGALLAIVLVRFLLAPAIQAGVFFSLHSHEPNPFPRFVDGLKRLFKPFLACYAFQTLLTLAPLYWIWPKLAASLHGAQSYVGILLNILPYAVGWWAYGFLIRLIIMHIQFGQMTGRNWKEASHFILRHLGASAVLMMIVLLLSSLALGLLFTGSFIWSGLVAVLLYQLNQLFQSWFQLWSIAAQYQLWSARM